MKGQLNDGRTIMVKDYLEAYWWVRDNTPQDARIMVGRGARRPPHVGAVSQSVPVSCSVMLSRATR